MGNLILGGASEDVNILIRSGIANGNAAWEESVLEIESQYEMGFFSVCLTPRHIGGLELEHLFLLDHSPQNTSGRNLVLTKVNVGGGGKVVA